MVESEEVSLQATAEARERFCCSKCDREVVPQMEWMEWNGMSMDFSCSLSNRTIKCMKKVNAMPSQQYYRPFW